jgi:phosphate transport system substrate-binding protein
MHDRSSNASEMFSPGENAYPISSFTWLLVPEKFDDKNKLRVMKDFLQWISTDGQKLTEELLYVPLPAEIVAQEQAAFSKIHETVSAARPDCD